MIYLDHAATSYPKPPCVYRALANAAARLGANPGRGGYRMALETTEALYRCRESAAALFGLSDPRRVVLMPNCTTALNTAIKGLLSNGGHAVASDLEHNAVLRPLHAAASHYTLAHVSPDDDETVRAFAEAITPHTRLLVCTHASNVTGQVLPVRRLAALAHEHGLPLVVDAAQSAGIVPIDVEGDALDYVCVAGHKGTFGPMGTGLLLCRDDTPLPTLVEGGTGSASLAPTPPLDLPERLESGTPNVWGFCALGAGLEWVRARGTQAIAAHELSLAARVYDALSSFSHVRLCSPPPKRERSTAVISFVVDGMTSEEAAHTLACGGLAVRAGLHCAPTAHRTLGTLPDGAVRLSFGAFNTRQDAENCIQFLKKIRSNALFFMRNYDKMK